MLRLRDIMTPDPLTVSPTTTLREAAELLSMRHIGGAPVVDGATLVGVVSASDILAFAAAALDDDRARSDAPDADEWREAHADDPQARFLAEHPGALDLDVVDEMADAATELDPLDRHTVADVMTHRVMALPSATDVVTAAARLREADVHRVLVVDGDRLVGVVTTSDITRVVAERSLERRVYVFDTTR
ncbi:MAG: CBS domain-containing protein [Gemmatirosa sp.]